MASGHVQSSIRVGRQSPVAGGRSASICQKIGVHKVFRRYDWVSHSLNF